MSNQRVNSTRRCLPPPPATCRCLLSTTPSTPSVLQLPVLGRLFHGGRLPERPEVKGSQQTGLQNRRDALLRCFVAQPSTAHRQRQPAALCPPAVCRRPLHPAAPCCPPQTPRPGSAYCMQVGACIVDQRNVICGIGYNGFPRGCSDSQVGRCCLRACLRACSGARLLDCSF